MVGNSCSKDSVVIVTETSKEPGSVGAGVCAFYSEAFIFTSYILIVLYLLFAFDIYSNIIF